MTSFKSWRLVTWKISKYSLKYTSRLYSSATPPFVACIDAGTSSTRVLIFDSNGSIASKAQKTFSQIHPRAGWAEHDPNEILAKTKECIHEAVAKLPQGSLVKAMGVTNQRETTCVWDSETGEPLHNAIVWLDTRTRQLVHTLTQKTHTKQPNHFADKCGLPFSTYFSAVKLKWLLENVDAVRKANNNKRLMFGTIDTWLVYKLTGGVKGGAFVTDVTNASRTMLMDIKTRSWDSELCEFFEISPDILPQIKSSSEVYGHVSSGVLKNVPIAGIIGDQQAALVGQLCIQKGQLKNTYGTGCFMLCNTGETPVLSTSGLLTTVAYQMGPNAPCIYALEGSISIAGASIKWLRDNMGIISSSEEVGLLSDTVQDTGGIYFVPAFSGLFAPYWRDDARGAIVGMTQYTTKAHLCRAALESVSYQTKDIMDCMSKDTGYPIDLLRVDGGMCQSDQLMQIQADIAGAKVQRPSMLETTAFGAALCAGRAVGVYDLDSFVSGSTLTSFSPKIDSGKRDAMRAGWRKAVGKSVGWES